MTTTFGFVRGDLGFKRRLLPAGTCCRVATKAVALVVGLLLAGCATMPQWGPDDREKLVKASDDYNNLLRWKDLDKVCVTFAEESVKDKCLEHALTLKDVQITDVRTRYIDFKIDGVEATVHAEIEYYLLPSTNVKKLQDTQRWRYIGLEGARTWFIRSPVPNFAVP